MISARRLPAAAFLVTLLTAFPAIAQPALQPKIDRGLGTHDGDNIVWGTAVSTRSRL